MLLVTLNWMFVTAIIYLYGAGLISLFKKIFSIQFEKPLHFTLVCVTGMAVTTFLVTALCLFIPLGLLAHGIVLIPAVLFAVKNKEKIRADWQYYRAAIKEVNWLYKAVFICFFLVIGFISAWPTAHFDEGLYYAQSMKWLQEYGTVPGLANINHRFGFNSSWLILQSFFGQPFFGMKAFNDLNGLLYLLLFIYWLQGIIAIIKGNRQFHTFLQAFFFLPALGLYFGTTSETLLFNENLIGSSSTDVPACFITWFTFLLFLKKVPDAGLMKLNKMLVGIIACYLISIKLSTIPILLLTVFCWWQFIRQRAFREAALLTITGILFLVPWLARNVIVSGYLLFPFHKLDLFQADWKLSPGRVRDIEEIIQKWAINSENGQLHNLSSSDFTGWFPDWFARQPFIVEGVLILVMMVAVSGFVYILYQIFSRKMSFLHRNNHYIIFFITALAGIVLWLLKAPDPRFGFGFTVFFAVFGLAGCLYLFAGKYARRTGMVVFLVAPLLLVFQYDLVWGNKPLKKMIVLPTHRFPKQTDTIRLSPEIPLYLATGDDCWDCALPCTINEYCDYGIRMRGKTLKQGFREILYLPRVTKKTSVTEVNE